MRRTKKQLIAELEDLQERLRIAEQAGHIDVAPHGDQGARAGEHGARLTAGTAQGERAEREGLAAAPGEAGTVERDAGEALTAGGREDQEAAGLLAVSEEAEEVGQAAVEVGREEEGALAARGSESREAAAERAFAALSDPKKERLLRHYVNSGGQVTKAARLAGVASRTHYHWMANDPLYAAAFEAAKLRTLDIIEAEIIRRGVKGYKEPIIYQGQVTGYVRRYSDNLLMFLAKRRDPLYRDNPQLALGLKAAGDIKISLSIPRPDEPAAIDAEAREVPDRATQPVDNTPAR